MLTLSVHFNLMHGAVNYNFCGCVVVSPSSGMRCCGRQMDQAMASNLSCLCTSVAHVSCATTAQQEGKLYIHSVQLFHIRLRRQCRANSAYVCVDTRLLPSVPAGPEGSAPLPLPRCCSTEALPALPALAGLVLRLVPRFPRRSNRTMYRPAGELTA